jgi:redox-sensing transcriptional repressor
MSEIDEQLGQPTRAIPEPTLRRLPIYHRYLKKIEKEGQSEYISSVQIGTDLNILPIQVRKDLEVTEVAGKPKLGYGIAELISRIEDFLGWNNSTEGYLVGVGNLGSALLGYQGFRQYGLNIVAAFDTDERKVGTEIHGVKILHADKLANMIRRMGIKIGILTVPDQYAQELVDLMVNAGIRAIWNFSPSKISVPRHVIVQHEDLASSLGVLSKKLAMTLITKTKE